MPCGQQCGTLDILSPHTSWPGFNRSTDLVGRLYQIWHPTGVNHLPENSATYFRTRTGIWNRSLIVWMQVDRLHSVCIPTVLRHLPKSFLVERRFLWWKESFVKGLHSPDEGTWFKRQNVETIPQSGEMCCVITDHFSRFTGRDNQLFFSSCDEK